MDETGPERLANRMAVVNMMKEQWEQNPPNFKGEAESLESMAKLLEIAAGHLAEKNFAEAYRCLEPLEAPLLSIIQSVRFSFILSGQASELMIEKLRGGLSDEH